MPELSLEVYYREGTREVPILPATDSGMMQQYGPGYFIPYYRQCSPTAPWHLSMERLAFKRHTTRPRIRWLPHSDGGATLLFAAIFRTPCTWQHPSHRACII